jgi:hypothetical protein
VSTHQRYPAEICENFNTFQDCDFNDLRSNLEVKTSINVNLEVKTLINLNLEVKTLINLNFEKSQF